MDHAIDNVDTRCGAAADNCSQITSMVDWKNNSNLHFQQITTKESVAKRLLTLGSGQSNPLFVVDCFVVYIHPECLVLASHHDFWMFATRDERNDAEPYSNSILR